MKILSIGGTRPQFVKMAILVKAFNDYKESNNANIEHRLLHTGQHYDSQMSRVFFDELDLPKPCAILPQHPGPPGMQTASILATVEASLKSWVPDAVVIYGDTNSTLAAALATVKLHIPLIHLEAGLRSFNRKMQEEINRIVSDHVSDLLLCPTRTAMDQLRTEGLGDRAVLVGDVMLDAVAQFAISERFSSNLRELGLENQEYLLVTIHRAETTDDARKLSGVIRALELLRLPIVIPIHPRLRHMLGAEGVEMLCSYPHIHPIEPVGYLEMLILEQRARLILTDSGGVQKEAYFLGVPCVTLRDETEWVETVQGGWNTLAGTLCTNILTTVQNSLCRFKYIGEQPRDLSAFGGGKAGKCCVNTICDFVKEAS